MRHADIEKIMLPMLEDMFDELLKAKKTVDKYKKRQKRIGEKYTKNNDLTFDSEYLRDFYLPKARDRYTKARANIAAVLYLMGCQK